MPAEVSIRNTETQDHGLRQALDNKIVEQVGSAITSKKPIHAQFDICNTNRTVGAILSGKIASQYGHTGLPDDTIKVKFKGTAGQSFGAFLARGVTFLLEGETNDYTGKGLCGGKIIVRPPEEFTGQAGENVIVGNTVLYGGVDGEVYFCGFGGERFAVRNSGAEAVIEGCDSNGCEYMTGGTIIILGKVGDNFAAGMTGGMAFIYDLKDEFEKRVNPETVVWQRPETKYWISHLKDLIIEHYKETDSMLSKKILSNFENEINNFFQVCPKEMINKLENPISANLHIKEVS